MPNRKPLNVQHRPSPIRVSPIPQLVDRQRSAFFARADQWAAQILRATVTGADHVGDEQVWEALSDLMQRSSYYKEADFRQQEDGNLMIACQESGLMLGLAFGLRLRGAA